MCKPVSWHVEMGIDDEDLEDLAVDKAMLNAVKEHVEVKDKDEEDDE